MIKYTKLLSILFALVVLTVSCTDDLDTLAEDDDTTSAVLSTDAEFRSFLAGVYGNLGQPGQTGAFDSSISGIDGGTSTWTRTMWYMQTLSTDEAIWSYENDAGVADLQRGVWNDTNPFSLGIFSRMAQTIAFSNELIRQSANVTVEEVPQIDTYVAEARFLRAMQYYYMLDLFGKAPFATEADPVSAEFRPTQIEGQELFDYVESELMAIMPTLLEKGAGDYEYGRATKAAAQMLLAKLYLNAEVYIGQAKYTEAITQLNAVIGNSQYMLEPDYHHNFTADNHLSNEIIFSVISDGVSTQNFGGTTVIINGEVGSVEGNGVDLGVPGFGGALRLKEEIADFLGSNISGVRNSMLTAGRTQRVENVEDQASGYTHTKFKNVDRNGDPGSNNGETAFVDTDFPIFRLADAYLMYAEAVWRGGAGGSDAQAVQYLADLRMRAGGEMLPTSAALTEDLIFNERTVEMFWEGHRRQDLRRFGRFTGGTYVWDFKGNVPSGASTPAFREVYPLPAQSIGANPNLTQNTGY